MLEDETVIDQVMLQQEMAGLLKWCMQSMLVKLWKTVSIPEVIFQSMFSRILAFSVV